MKSIYMLIIGVILGAVITMVVLYTSAPGMMLLEDESPYGFQETISRLEAATEAQGWKIPAKHDLQKSMKKFGHDIAPVTVIELCHPDLATRILSSDDERVVSSLMPCRLAVYEKHGKVYVSRMNSKLMAKPMGGLVNEVMSEASAQNEEILKSIIQ